MTDSNSWSLLPHRILSLFLRIVRQARELQLQNTTASLAFLSLLAIVPIFSIILAVLTALPVFASLRDGLQAFLARNLFLPAISDTLLQYVNQFAAQASQLSMAGAAAFFATALGCLLTIDKTLNRIWGAPRARPLTQRLTLYWSLLTVAPLVLGASIAANGLVVSEWLRGGEYAQVRQAWFTSLPWVTTAVGLLLLYRLVPSATVRWREALAGALFATVLIQWLRGALGFYFAKLPTYTVIYGAFSVLPLLLVWLFTLWLIVLAGALLASNLRFWSQSTPPRLTLTPSEQFGDALLILRLLVKSAPRGNGHGLPASLWREAFADDAHRAETAVRFASARGYVDRMLRVDVSGAGTSDGPVWDEFWSLSQSADRLSLAALFVGAWGGPMQGVACPALDEPLDRWARETAAAA